ncbi:MAG: tetratricopeptide repeat protein [Sediminibacterium sp.]
MRIFPCIIFAIVFISCNNPKGGNSLSTKTTIYPVFVQDLMQAIDRFPDSTELRVQLIDTMDSLNLTKDAISQIDILIARDSGNYGNWFRKGEIAIHAADTSIAIESFSRAATLYATPDVLLTLANLYAAQKNKTALILCDRVIAQKPDRNYIAHSYYIIGLYYENTGNTSAAIEKFNTCIQQNYYYLEAYLEVGWIYFDQQKFTDAKEIFETATAVKPTDARGHYWTAKCLEKMGQLEKAINAYQLAFNLDNSLSEASAAISRIKATKK